MNAVVYVLTLVLVFAIPRLARRYIGGRYVSLISGTLFTIIIMTALTVPFAPEIERVRWPAASIRFLGSSDTSVGRVRPGNAQRARLIGSARRSQGRHG